MSLNTRKWPPIVASWSFSLYDAGKFFFVDNPLGRYAIGVATPAVTGSLHRPDR